MATHKINPLNTFNSTQPTTNHTHTHVHTHAQTHTHAHTHSFTQACTHTHTHTCTSTHPYAHTHTHTDNFYMQSNDSKYLCLLVYYQLATHKTLDACGETIMSFQFCSLLHQPITSNACLCRMCVCVCACAHMLACLHTCMPMFDICTCMLMLCM